MACRLRCRPRRIFLLWESSPSRSIAVPAKRRLSSSRLTPNAESSPSGPSRAPDQHSLSPRFPRRGAARHHRERAERGSARSPLQGREQCPGGDRAKLLACLRDGSVRREIELDAQRASRSGAHATPSFYIEGGLLQGAPYTPDPMRQVLDSVYAVRTRASQ